MTTISSSPTAPAPSKGFTLLEVLLALTLFAVGTLGMLDVVHRAHAASADAENVLTATHLAQRRFEELRNVTYASITNEAKARVGSPSGFSRFCREVAVTTPYTNLKQIVVTVSWDPPDCLTTTTPNVVLQTYRSAD